jgi:YHS domain-containing protein
MLHRRTCAACCTAAPARHAALPHLRCTLHRRTCAARCTAALAPHSATAVHAAPPHVRCTLQWRKHAAGSRRAARCGTRLAHSRRVQDPHIGGVAPAALTRDPVCGRELQGSDPRLRSQYADVTYEFCSQECRARFDEQPDIFTAQPGRGEAAERDRAQRQDDDRSELAPGQPARLSNSPPTPGAG